VLFVIVAGSVYSLWVLVILQLISGVLALREAIAEVLAIETTMDAIIFNPCMN